MLTLERQIRASIVIRLTYTSVVAYIMLQALIPGFAAGVVRWFVKGPAVSYIVRGEFFTLV